MCDLTVFVMPGRDNKNKKRFIMIVYAIISPHLPLPHAKTIFPFTLFILHLSFIYALFRVFVILFAFYFLPIVVDRLLYLFFCSSIYYFLPSWGYISIVFKIGSTVLQRTIYDPILEAILIPKCTYFHL